MVSYHNDFSLLRKNLAEENQNESESPQPKLPKPSSPAIEKPAVQIKTTLETPMKDNTEIPKTPVTRLKTTSESKEILEKYVSFTIQFIFMLCNLIE